MKKKYSKLAIASLVLGLTAILFALTRAGGPVVLALPIGVLAICCGGAAAGLIHKASSTRRGKGLAVSGVFLGALAMGFSVLALVGIFFQQIKRQQSWNQSRQTTEALRVNPMRDVPAIDFTSNLPIAILETSGQSISKGEETVVRARFFNTGNGRASVNADPNYDGLGTMELRGTTTLHLPKRPYAFHTVDSKTNQTKVSLLGLPAEEDWVLCAPFEDKSMMRDVLAFELANKMGHYAPRTRYIELFVNTSGRPLSMRDYVGVYVLMEKIKRGKDRVNIAKLEPQHRSEPEITGGYIVKRDHGDGDGGRFRTSHGGPYFYVYPKAGAITSEQRSWLTRYFNSFENALYGPNFADRQNGYAAYLDVDAFIDSHWLIEMSKNVDGFRYSAFLTKDRGAKLKPGPAWDWNRSFGNANYYGGGQVQGWYSSNLRPNEISWYLRLREDPDFMQRSTARWIALRKNVFDPKKISARIDELAAELEEAQQRNFERWPILGQHVTCNFYVGQSFEDEVRWLKNWIERRIAWIDSQLGASAQNL
jgi:hypothetical protein